MPRSAGGRSGPSRLRGLPACFEAARVRQKAKLFRERNHDTNKITLLPANAMVAGHPKPYAKVVEVVEPQKDAALARMLRSGT